MNKLTVVSALIFTCLFTLLCPKVSAADGKKQAVSYNNEGVGALKDRNWDLAIKKFEAALKTDSNYSVAKKNLSVAHNNLAMHLAAVEHNPDKALNAFHQSVYLDPDNKTTEANFKTTIRMLGKNPDSFDDRLYLAECAKKNNDLVGELVEYQAALKIRQDSSLQGKIKDLRTKIKAFTQ